MKKCESCGKLYSPSKDVFCPRCGAVATKKCTHSSNFDASRFDRGEDYKGSTDTRYKAGTEPHAQRTKSGNIGEEKKISFPPINIPTINADKQNTGKKNFSVGIVVFVIIFLVNVFISMVDSDDMDSVFGYDETEWEEQVDPLFLSEWNAECSRAEIIVDEYSFRIVMKDILLEQDGLGEDEYHRVMNTIMLEDIYTEVTCCSFEDKRVSQEVYDNTISNEYAYCYGEYGEHAGDRAFSYTVVPGKIVCVYDYYIYFEEGGTVRVSLPFDAFSVDDKGEITYYSSFASEDTEWYTEFKALPPVDGELYEDIGAEIFGEYEYIESENDVEYAEATVDASVVYYE